MADRREPLLSETPLRICGGAFVRFWPAHSKPQGSQNQGNSPFKSILCYSAKGVAGAAGGVAATATFSVLTGNFAGLTPAALRGGAAVGAAANIAGPGIVGSIVSGAASILGHIGSGYSPGGLTGVYNDAINGSSAPGYAGAAGASGGALFGAASAATAFEEAEPILSSVGIGSGARVACWLWWCLFVAPSRVFRRWRAYSSVILGYRAR